MRYCPRSFGVLLLAPLAITLSASMALSQQEKEPEGDSKKKRETYDLTVNLRTAVVKKMTKISVEIRPDRAFSKEVVLGEGKFVSIGGVLIPYTKQKLTAINEQLQQREKGTVVWEDWPLMLEAKFLLLIHVVEWESADNHHSYARWLAISPGQSETKAFDNYQTTIALDTEETAKGRPLPPEVSEE